MIVSANLFHEKNVTLSVLFCSLSNATQIWSIRDRPIDKSIEMTESLRRKLVSINVYNVTIDCDGYIANLTISSNSDAQFSVRLQNDFGETRHTFRLDLVKVKDAVHGVGPHELSTIPIYHAAPSSAPVIHLYDTANSGYLEIIDNGHNESNSSESDNKDSGEDSPNTTNNAHVYEDID
ncbi:unnamed protein product [Mytilus edulis]|uniref:Uncharacterized protein n=1 Tax=Mytilus edulis TaxID=6550 RepID=A0A8S3RJG5_MYTED|nr:unnamed protein product [Mytilus edulis]